MYYAFAEDIRPSGAQRTESDLRFIDIRPFRRTFRVFDNEDGMGMGQGSQLKSLEELIARQRYALNRSIQLDRRFKQSGQADLSGVDSLIKFQGELAKFTRELAEGLQRRGVDDTELLFQAEASMLGATDSLSAGNYETATLQERDALKYLIEGRNRIQQSILKNPNRQQLAKLRSFDRMQRQKLRRPKSDEQEAKELVQKLEQLADEEDFVYTAIGGLDPALTQSKQQVQDPPPGSTGSTNNQPMPASTPAEGDKPAARPDGDKPMGAGDKPMPDGQQAKGEGGKPMAEGDKPMADGQEPGAGKAQATREELEDKQQMSLPRPGRSRRCWGGSMASRIWPRSGSPRLPRWPKKGPKQFPAASWTKPAARPARPANSSASWPSRCRRYWRRNRPIGLPPRSKSRLSWLASNRSLPTSWHSRSNPAGLAAGRRKRTNSGPAQATSRCPMRKTIQKASAVWRKRSPKGQDAGRCFGAAARADTPEEQETGKKVDELAKGMGIGDLTERLKNLPGQVGEGKLEDAKVTAGDGAERLEATAEQLGLLHRSIVAPKVDELAKVERELANLDQRLDQLDTPTKITGWHMDADELQDELDKGGVPEELRQEFVEEMKRGGWGDTGRTGGWKWGRTEGGYYAAPGGYRVLISRMQESIRNRMQELLLGDLASSRDERIPPQYQEFVDRYYQVLAAEGKEKMKKGTGERGAKNGERGASAP